MKNRGREDLYHLFRTQRDDEREGGTGVKGKTRGKKKQKGNFPIQTPREEMKRKEGRREKWQDDDDEKRRGRGGEMKCGDEGRREGGVWWCEGKKESEGKKKAERREEKKEKAKAPPKILRVSEEGRRRTRCGDYTRWLASRKEGVQCVLCGGAKRRVFQPSSTPPPTTAKSSICSGKVEQDVTSYRSGFRSRNRFTLAY